jgi:hypothetical protein
VLWYKSVIAVDLVDLPLAGGCFLQSDAAAAAGAPVPLPPKIPPTPSPTRESSAPVVRYARTAPRSRREEIDTELSIIPSGGNYPLWH